MSNRDLTYVYSCFLQWEVCNRLLLLRERKFEDENELIYTPQTSMIMRNCYAYALFRYVNEWKQPLSETDIHHA